MLREAYTLAAIDFKRARDKQPIKRTKDPQFKVRGPMLLKNKKRTWDIKYMPNFCIFKGINDRA